MSLDLQQGHLVPCTAQKSTLRRSSARTSSHERPVNVHTISVATRSCLRNGTFGLTQLPPMPSSYQEPCILLTVPDSTSARRLGLSRNT